MTSAQEELKLEDSEHVCLFILHSSLLDVNENIVCIHGITVETLVY
jgi:hypothetical protein